ncbi:MAG: type IV pilin [Nitrososphaerota archaeon]|nr:type IV pilin [Nitrososphaerota archaeon]MDG6921656.1 type IV pilin [Nitrososphaerota archaeon]
MQITNGQRKGISPVIATVILIAITLIAAIAIAGFVFGLFGSFTSTARVSGTATCASGTALSCTLTLSNTGTAATTITGVTITFGTETNLALGPAASTAAPITAGQNNVYPGLAPATSTAANSGETFLMTVTLANGGSVPISGTFT